LRKWAQSHSALQEHISGSVGAFNRATTRDLMFYQCPTKFQELIPNPYYRVKNSEKEQVFNQ